MSNKTIILLVVALVVIAYFLYNKSQSSKPATVTLSSGAEVQGGSDPTGASWAPQVSPHGFTIGDVTLRPTEGQS